MGRNVEEELMEQAEYRAQKGEDRWRIYMETLANYVSRLDVAIKKRLAPLKKPTSVVYRQKNNKYYKEYEMDERYYQVMNELSASRENQVRDFDARLRYMLDLDSRLS